jgi:hypothetical protein
VVEVEPTLNPPVLSINVDDAAADTVVSDAEKSSAITAINTATRMTLK